MNENVKKLDIDTDNLNVEVEEDKVIVSIKKEENHTLEDLRQKLIKDLYEKNFYESVDVQIMRMLFSDCKGQSSLKIMPDGTTEISVSNSKTKNDNFKVSDDGNINITDKYCTRAIKLL